MRRLLLPLVLLVLPLSFGAQPGPSSTTSRTALTPGTWAVTGVTVIPMTRDTQDREAVLRNATVLIRDGRIAAVGTRVDVPRDARRIDGRGKYLIPGLVDMHAHLFADEFVHDSVAPYELGVFLAHGVTTARLMIGTPRHFPLRDGLEAGRLTGPQLWIASPQFAGRKDPNSMVVTTAEEARAAVQQAADAGYDFIKLTVQITPEVFDAVVDAAKTRGIRVVGHVDPRVGVARALAAGQQIEHFDNYMEAVLADSAPMKTSISDVNIYYPRNWPSVDFLDDAKVARIAGATARAGVGVTPTIAFFRTFLEETSDSAVQARPDWTMMPSNHRDLYWRARQQYWRNAPSAARRARVLDVRNRLIRAVVDSGGMIFAGSDAPGGLLTYGWTMHRELEALVDAGLTPYQALRAGTAHPAAFLSGGRDFGTITTGQRADLVLLDADPLADIRNTTRIAGVAIGGRFIEPPALARMIDEARVRLVSAAPPPAPAANPSTGNSPAATPPAADPVPNTTTPAPDAREAVRAVSRAVQAWNDSLAATRSLAATWGAEPDAVRDERVRRSGEWVATLDRVDRASLAGTPEALLHLGLREGLARQAATRVCRDERWNVSPLDGPHLALSNTLAAGVRDSAAADRVLARLRALPEALAEHVRTLEAGMSSGHTASRDNVDRVLEQIDLLIEQLSNADESPLLTLPAVAASATSVRALVTDTVAAAVTAYRTFLHDRYRDRARAEGSLASLAGGADCYRARLRFMTGIDTPAESLAVIAAARRAAVDAELAPILRRLVGDRPLAEAKRAIRTESRFLFTSREEMLAEARVIDARLTPAVGKLFRTPPNTPLVIESTPAVRERSDPPARYSAPNAPGAPGTFYLNTWRPDSQPRWAMVTAVSHEGAPGHHFERTYARTVDVPAAARSFGTGAYTEGWGMYAEEVAVRESGVLDDDLSRVGLLMHYLDAWIALELDIRMHLDGLSREEVIARTMEGTGKSRTVAEVYADRHAATPGQLASYMIGYLVIRALRDDAERTLGSRFDVRDFHERVLETGPIPLTIVQDRVRAWLGDR